MNEPSIDLATMTACDLATQATYVQTGWKNVYTQELCRRAGLLAKYEEAYTNDDAMRVVKRASSSFGITLI